MALILYLIFNLFLWVIITDTLLFNLNALLCTWELKGNTGERERMNLNGVKLDSGAWHWTYTVPQAQGGFKFPQHWGIIFFPEHKYWLKGPLWWYHCLIKMSKLLWKQPISKCYQDQAGPAAVLSSSLAAPTCISSLHCASFLRLDQLYVCSLYVWPISMYCYYNCFFVQTWISLSQSYLFLLLFYYC